ncbi:MAG: hypothetical protein LN414_08320, partial [Candidatus Thermoplasmatota archaeon]|nr:hypothetical protein [Candidatus Thermoplasmatota archaeon]
SYNGTFKIHREYFDTILFRNCSFNGMTLAFDQPRWASLETNVSVVDCSFEGHGGYLTFLFSSDTQYDWEYSSATFPVPTGGFVNNTFSGEGSGVVLHHDLFESFLVGSSFSEGAIAWAWYAPLNVAASAEPVDGGNPEVVVLNDASYHVEFPFIEYEYNMEEGYYRDVTGHLISALDPAPLDVVILWRTPYGNTRMIADYGQIQLDVNRNVLTYRVWPDIQGLLQFYIDDWPWDDMENWEGSRW